MIIKLQPLVDGTSVALEFVNIISHIFQLDPAIRNVVDVLKSNLLRLIGIYFLNIFYDKK